MFYAYVFGAWQGAHKTRLERPLIMTDGLRQPLWPKTRSQVAQLQKRF